MGYRCLLMVMESGESKGELRGWVWFRAWASNIVIENLQSLKPNFGKLRPPNAAQQPDA
jgi:hypothetical protein